MTKRTTATQRTVLLETISAQGDMHVEVLSTTLAALIVDAGLPDLGYSLADRETTVRHVDAPALEALVKLADAEPNPDLLDDAAYSIDPDAFHAPGIPARDGPAAAAYAKARTVLTFAHGGVAVDIIRDLLTLADDFAKSGKLKTCAGLHPAGQRATLFLSERKGVSSW